VIIICAFYVKFKSATRRAADSAADCGSADPDLGPGEYGLGDCDWDDDDYDYPDAIREEQSAVPPEDAETNWADDGMDSDGVTDL
jgi:hypothetical protein